MPTAGGVIEHFLHPSFRELTSSVTRPTFIPNPLRGTVTLEPGAFLIVSYGIVWAVSFAPPQAGVELGVLPTYEDRVFDLVVTHTLDSGLVVVSQRFSTHESNGILFWENLLPTNVTLSIFPNFELTVEWLVLG